MNQVLNNIQHRSQELYDVVIQYRGWLFFMGLLIAFILYLGSEAAIRKCTIRKCTLEMRELVAWLCIDGLVGITAAGVWKELVKAEDVVAFLFIGLLTALRVYTRVKFYCQKKREHELRDLEHPAAGETGKELEVQMTNMQIVAMRRLLSRIPASDVLAREGDTLQDAGHMVGALQAIQTALDSDGHGRE